VFNSEDLTDIQPVGSLLKPLSLPSIPLRDLLDSLSAFAITYCPLPTTLILANVWADTRDLNTLKIQVRRFGIFMKSFRDRNSG